jgi:hypothetical protein
VFLNKKQCASLEYVILLAGMMRFFMTTMDAFSDAEAGAHFFDLPFVSSR